jgi:MinD superfamily P-loop ATPase
MRVAIASGKGGTGKTTIATSLAAVAARSGATTAYLDCDVEEPNGHLFLNPEIVRESVVGRQVPRVDPAKCQHCGECTRICRFGAMVFLDEQTLMDDELCHSCGGCALVCPSGAITEVQHPVGVVKAGAAGSIQFVSGTLNVGEPASLPVIRAVKQAAPPADWTFIDAPHGAPSPVSESARGCDFLLLVIEPAPFGLHDLRLALDMAKSSKLKCGVVINRALVGHPEARQLCQQARIPILAEIPDSMAVAEACSEGQLAVEAVPGLRRVFAQLLLRLAAVANTDALPGEVRRNLEKWAAPGGEPSSPISQTPNAPPPAVCYLALRNRRPNPSRHRAGSSPDK